MEQDASDVRSATSSESFRRRLKGHEELPRTKRVISVMTTEKMEA
jgi:hypothetical protein